MNENKFLKNLNQTGNQLPAFANPPAESVPPRRTPPPAPAVVEYDPVKRLADELSRHSKAIEELTKRLDKQATQPQAATQSELELLLKEAQQGVRTSVNIEKLAQTLLPELTKGIPTEAGIKAAAEEAVSAIKAAGITTAEQIQQAGTNTINRIEWAGQRKADAFTSRIGFTSWKAAACVYVLLLLTGVGTALYVNHFNDEVDAMRVQDNATKEFVGWIQEKYPNVWKAYLDKINKK